MSDNYLAANSPDDYKFIYDCNASRGAAGQELGAAMGSSKDLDTSESSYRNPGTRKVEGYVNATKEQLNAIYDQRSHRRRHDAMQMVSKVIGHHHPQNSKRSSLPKRHKIDPCGLP